MQRRTILKRIGAASVAATGYAGTVSASRPRPGIDRDLDVSDVSGVVKLDALVEEDVEPLLDDEYVARLPADTEPAEVELFIAEHADVINLSDDDCCIECSLDQCAYWCDCCEIERC